MLHSQASDFARSHIDADAPTVLFPSGKGFQAGYVLRYARGFGTRVVVVGTVLEWASLGHLQLGKASMAVATHLVGRERIVPVCSPVVEEALHTLHEGPASLSWRPAGTPTGTAVDGWFALNARLAQVRDRGAAARLAATFRPPAPRAEMDGL